MRHLILIMLLSILTTNIARAQVYHIHSPRIATKSSIHIKCHSCTLNKHPINKTPSSSSAVYTKKEELIDGKKAMITTDNFMGGEPITFIKYLFEEDKK
ncbi:HPE1 family effector [Candidatus Liberibacter asiaticus]